MYMKKILLCIAALGISSGLKAEKTSVSTDSYYAGGVVGTLVGLGIGHAIQERYGQIGWVFTVGEVAGLGLIGGGIGWAIAKAPAGATYIAWDDMPKGAFGLIIAGSALAAAFKIWEIVDVWAGAKPVADEARHAFLHPKRSRNMLIASNQNLGSPVFSFDYLIFKF